jgi:hypothetical protein
MRNLDDRAPLDPLDPGSRDPGFWIRFHAAVMAQAKDELARRRMVGELTITDVVFRWRKALVPLTLVAASLAGILALDYGEPVDPLGPIALEEALVEDLNGDPIPTVLGAVAELDEVAFLSAAGGF